MVFKYIAKQFIMTGPIGLYFDSW